MSIMFIEAMLITVIAAATPLLLAATGELIVEKSGILNLGVEGMMLIGAITGFAISVTPGFGHTSALFFAAFAGAFVSLLFAFLVLNLKTNQVATGLALTIFGIGASSLIGTSFTGMPTERLPKLPIPILADIPIIGPVFNQDILVYFSFFMIALVAFVLTKTRLGLIIRAVGENHDSAHALGFRVISIRYCTIMFGGSMAALGGAYLSLARTPHWADGMTAGKGWIALALIVFATWRPGRLLMGAYLFGAIAILELYAQAASVPVPSNFLSMLPYLVTIIVLVAMSRNPEILRKHAPNSIGKIFEK